MTTTKQTMTTVVLAGPVARDKFLSWLGLAGAVAVAAVLNLWNLAQNGYDNLYYAVAVQSMLQSWHNFFFAAYDAGGFISVDKPPVALWLETLSARLLGFNGVALLLPQALASVASVALVYVLVRRLFGTLAGLVAALALALTPIAVAVDRSNNMDTLLMCTLLLAAWVLTLATEKGRLSLLAGSLALVGVAFNIKMLEAFIVLPTFYLLYLLAVPLRWPRRLLHLAVGSVVLLVTALSWPLAVDLTPPAARPWVGGSQANSVIDLALGYNGFGRVTGQGELLGGRGRGPGGFGSGAPGGFPNFGAPPASGPGGRLGGGLFDAGAPGPGRLFSGALAGQWSWLFPLAVLGVIASLLGLRRRQPLEPRGQALILWLGWLATYGVVFSSARGIFHPYYLLLLGPAAAALVGSGVAGLWAAYRRGGWRAGLLPAALLGTAVWQLALLSSYPQWAVWITPLVLGGSVLAAVPLLAGRLMSPRVWRRWAPGLVGADLVALLVAPLAWAVTPLLAAPSNASLPEAGPATLSRPDPASWTRLADTANSPLLAYLEAHSAGYFYLLAVPNSQQASALILATGQPVVATGGFMGSDPALTPAKLATMVATKQVRFIMGLGGSNAVGGWVQAHCQAVDPRLYQDAAGSTRLPGGFGPFGGGNALLYDCAASPAA